MESDPTAEPLAHQHGGAGPLDITSAEVLVDPDVEARWMPRRQDRLLHQILRAFVERGGPIR
jgi:hypothetical protein